MLRSQPLPSNSDDKHPKPAEITELHKYPIAPDYLKNLFKWIALWAFFVIAFIWIVNPYGVSPIKINVHRFNANKPKRLDIDRLIKPYEVWRYQPKTIFIGTSRIHQSMDPSFLDGTKFAPAYNAAIPASTLAENADNIEQFIKLDPHIEDIFLELFFYNFTGQSQESHPKTWGQFFGNLTSLQISNDALLDSINTVVNNLKKRSPTPAHIAELGYRVPAGDYNPADTFSDALFIRTVTSFDHSDKLKLNPEAFKSLDRIVEIARKNHIKLHFILTPNYPWDDRRLIGLGYWPMLEQWMHQISKYPDVVSFSQYNAITQEEPTHEPKMKWWNDPIHFSLNTGRMMMNAYLGHPSKDMPANFMRHINSKTVKAVISERRAGAQKWGIVHSDFVSDFEEAKTFSDTITGTLNTKSQILTVNGKKHPITLGVGEISSVKNNGSTLTASGWTVDEIAKRHASLLVATIGDTIVSQGLATAKRQDIELALGKHPVASGFNIDIPLQNSDASKPIRVFALMTNGRAVQLPSQLKPIDGIPVTTLGLVKPKVIILNKKTYPIVERVAGSIETVTPIHQGYSVKGWVTHNRANGEVISVIGAIDDHIVAKGLLSIKRDESIDTSPSGFMMNLQLPADQLKDFSRIHFFALTSQNVALPITSNLLH